MITSFSRLQIVLNPFLQLSRSITFPISLPTERTIPIQQYGQQNINQYSLPVSHYSRLKVKTVACCFVHSRLTSVYPRYGTSRKNITNKNKRNKIKQIKETHYAHYMSLFNINLLLYSYIDKLSCAVTRIFHYRIFFLFELSYLDIIFYILRAIIVLYVCLSLVFPVALLLNVRSSLYQIKF